VHPPDDAELIAQVLAGRAERFALLVERYQDALYRHAVGMLGEPDAAADVVQDTFVKAYTHLATCQDPRRFSAWLFRILRNRCMDHLKNLRQRNVPLDDDAVGSAEDDPAAELECS
jgi:RNA polymerase sigma-70 factor (ECF subfamily)